MIDSDLTIRDISTHYDAYPNMKYICLLSDITYYPEDIDVYQISIDSRPYGIYRNMLTESTFPVRICCLCFGDNRKERRIFRHGG